MARMLLAISGSSRRLRSKNWRRSPLMRMYSGFLRIHINGGTRLRNQSPRSLEKHTQTGMLGRAFSMHDLLRLQ